MNNTIKNFARYALIALVAISVVMSGSVAASHGGKTITVDPATDGTVTDEYATVQEAVDAANETDHVAITPGTYNESVTVNTNDITLESTTAGSDVILDASNIDGEALTINATGVSVSDDIYVINKTGGSTLLASDEDTSTDDTSSFNLVDELTKDRFGVPYAAGMGAVALGGYFFYYREQ